MSMIKKGTLVKLLEDTLVRIPSTEGSFSSQIAVIPDDRFDLRIVSHELCLVLKSGRQCEGGKCVIVLVDGTVGLIYRNDAKAIT